MSGHHEEHGIDATKLPPELGRRLVTAGAALTGVGALGCLAAFVVDRQRFAFSYLTGFVWLVTIALGALFFVLIQHLTRAGWSVAARRHMEWITAVLPWCALLFLPVAAMAHGLYHHWMGESASRDALLKAKSGYLNPTFFFARAFVFFALWSLGARWFSRQSSAQDAGGDPAFTARMQVASAPSTAVFALTLTFAAFDWLMSLDPHWYSTIFGVYVFAGAVTSSLSALALITIALQRAGLLQRVSTVEHRHDIGKLLFGFTVFWAYIAFSQYFLIWYAGIPEETIFFKHRWIGGWRAVSLILCVGHFVVPFCVLMSRHAKRSALVLGSTSALLLAMHFVDLYWLVMPTLDVQGARFTWIDVVALALPLGVLSLVVAHKASRGPLFPVNDPRLAEATQLQNL